MFTDEVNDILFDIRVKPCYVENSKVLSNYCIFDNDHNKVVGILQENRTMMSNKDVINAIKKLSRWEFCFAYYRPDKSRFHIIGKTHTFYDNIRLGYEIVNSYNFTHIPSVYAILFINDEIFYTNSNAFLGWNRGEIYDVGQLYACNINYGELIQKLKRTVLTDADYACIDAMIFESVPAYLVKSIDAIRYVPNRTALDIIMILLNATKDWRSFETKRTFIHKLYRKMITICH